MFEFPRTPASAPQREPQSLAASLRQLAAQPAPFDDWPRMQAELRRHRAASGRHAWRDLALAASLLIGISLALTFAPEPLVQASATAAVTAPSLDQLQQESAWLEQWLRQQAEQRVAAPSIDAESLSARQELLAQLQFTDALLADQPAPDIEQALWQRRVLLLRQLSLEFGSSGLALSSALPAQSILL